MTKPVSGAAAPRATTSSRSTRPWGGPRRRSASIAVERRRRADEPRLHRPVRAVAHETRHAMPLGRAAREFAIADALHAPADDDFGEFDAHANLTGAPPPSASSSPSHMTRAPRMTVPTGQPVTVLPW